MEYGTTHAGKHFFEAATTFLSCNGPLVIRLPYGCGTAVHEHFGNNRDTGLRMPPDGMMVFLSDKLGLHLWHPKVSMCRHMCAGMNEQSRFATQSFMLKVSGAEVQHNLLNTPIQFSVFVRTHVVKGGGSECTGRSAHSGGLRRADS